MKDIVRADHVRLPLKRNSLGVKTENLVFVGGNLGVDSQRRLMGADIRSETRRALENRGILEAAGAPLQDVAKVSAFLVRKEDFDAFNEVYVEFFPSDPPVRTTVLAGLPTDGAVVEIDTIAVLPPTGSRRLGR